MADAKIKKFKGTVTKCLSSLLSLLLRFEFCRRRNDNHLETINGSLNSYVILRFTKQEKIKNIKSATRERFLFVLYPTYLIVIFQVLQTEPFVRC